MSHIWMRHVTHMNASCHTYECVMSQMRTSHVPYMDGVMPNMWMSHDSFICVSWLIHMCDMMMCIKSWCVSSHDVYQVMMCIKSWCVSSHIRMPIHFHISLCLPTSAYPYAYSLGYICMPIQCDTSVCLSWCVSSHIRMPIHLDISLRLFTARYLCAYSLRCIRVPIRYIGMPVDLDISVWLLTAIYADVYMHMPIDLQLDKPSHIYPHLGFRV